jgi:hypothetical protein
MTRPAAEPAHRAERVALIGLALAVLTLVILFISFRGLVYLTLPLSAAAFVLGTWGAVSGERPAHRTVAVVALVLGLLLLLASIGALAADLNISDRYDVYQRAR